MSVQQLWDNAWGECKGDTDLTNARVGGRATKANPNKEDVNFNACIRWNVVNQCDCDLYPRRTNRKRNGTTTVLPGHDNR